jgi:hypothetical protein
MIIIGIVGKITAIHIGYTEAALPGLVDEINAQLGKGVAKN